MKRLSILLGSLLVVGAVSYAKEAVVAPVIVEESKEVIVAPVIVEEEPGFRPSGYVDLQYRYYGKTENQENLGIDPDNTEGLVDPMNNGGNQRGRLQLAGRIQMTEKEKFEFRVRDWRSWRENDKASSTAGTETRLRYYYDHGQYADGKIDVASRIQYRSRGQINVQDAEYTLRLNFAKYLPEAVKDFTLAPGYMYSWNNDNEDNYFNKLGLDLYTYTLLPYGFEFEFNVYAGQFFYGRDQVYNYTTAASASYADQLAGAKNDPNAKIKDKNFELAVEAYIYKTINLYTDNTWTFDFNFEGGYDPYLWSQQKKVSTTFYDNNVKYVKRDQNSSYSLYMTPNVTANYKVTENLKVYAGIGAEYRNWNVEAQKDASDWRWQPQAWAGMKATF
ncbi:major outer membrane protein FomA [Cetobacterium sp. SF1]|uniref:major outer membrane protein FomA n=1 Tax=Cetobacterium sp. SF1 TaxID=3417654 RepID=UPI003CEF8424